MNRLLDRAVHPACHPTPMRPGQIVTRVSIGATLLVIGVVLWPSYWWFVIALFVGVCLVTHPLCLITGKKHKPGGIWFGLE